MTEPKFTKGPWNTDADVGHESVLGPDGAMVADCAIFINPRFGERSTATNVANARLISAAPDLYEALKQIAEGLANTGSTPGEYLTTMTKRDAAAIARAALAKADGGDSG